MKSLLLIFQSFSLVVYAHLSFLASLSVLFTLISLSSGNVSLPLRDILILLLEHLYILPKRQRSALKMHVLWYKAGIYS